MMNAENDELLKSMLTGMDGTSMETFDSLGVDVQETPGGSSHDELNLDEFNLELLSPISSSSSDGTNSVSDNGNPNPMYDETNVMAPNVECSEIDLIDYLSNGRSTYILHIRSSNISIWKRFYNVSFTTFSHF